MVGLEPTTPGLEVRCAIHCATLTVTIPTPAGPIKHARRPAHEFITKARNLAYQGICNSALLIVKSKRALATIT